MRRRSKPLLCLLPILTSGVVALLLLRHHSAHEDHVITKREVFHFDGENPPPDDQHFGEESQRRSARGGDNEPPEAQLDSQSNEGRQVPQHSPGRLICDSSGRPVIPPEEAEGGDGEGETPILPPDVVRPPRKTPIVTGWTDDGRSIGCCPPGEATGQPYREGMACCVNQVYNATIEFCCLSKSMRLLNTPENRMFCNPPDQMDFCRVEDLGLDELRPLDAVCTLTGDKRQTPSECVFVCPPGSQVRGDKRTTCTDEGTFSDADPQCCEGCPPSFTHDIWFVVETNEGIETGNLSNIRTFIRQATGFLPISQTQVRVAATAFNQDVITSDRAWFLDRYNSTAELNGAVNNLPREGTGRNTVAALTWVANNTFRGRRGDRIEVENLIVLITTGIPDDGSLLEVSANIRELARFIVIAVGPDASSSELQEAASPPTSRNYFRIPTFQELDEQNSLLYDIFCQEHCLSA